MAFMRSPVRSRSGPPSFAHKCTRRMPTVAANPWSLDVTITFADEAHAVAFESYLKSGLFALGRQTDDLSCAAARRRHNHRLLRIDKAIAIELVVAISLAFDQGYRAQGAKRL